MKLRILGHSIRLRLNQSETKLLSAGQAVREVVTIALHPPKELVYELLPCADTTNLAVDFIAAASTLQVRIPQSMAIRWASSDEVGCYDEVDLGQNIALKLSVEKDFQCLKPRAGDDDRDTFPHPAADLGHQC